MPETLKGALKDAARPPAEAAPWEVRLRERQAQIRKALVVEALRLQASKSESDRSLGRDLETFVRTLPPAATRRQILARALGEGQGRPERGRDRTR